MLQDRLLIWKFRNGSAEAFGGIYRKYADDLLTLAANLSGDKALAEDIVQDVFISFARSINEFRLTGSLKGYLAKCVANRARDYLRKQNRRQTVSIEQAEQIQADLEGAVWMAIKDEQLLRLAQAMTALPYEQREVIVLYIQAGLKFTRIAELRDISVKTVRSRYRYGLNKLRSMLNGEVKK